MLTRCRRRRRRRRRLTPLALEQRHVKTDEMLAKAVDMLHSFRNYVHYHIKCCKGYMHTR